MTSSMATLSRRLYRSLLWNPRFSQSRSSRVSMFSTTNFSSWEGSDLDESAINPDLDSSPEQEASKSSSQGSGDRRSIHDRRLEDGLDAGVYKAILVGQVGQVPLQKKLKNGSTITLFSLGTGGIKNNRRPLQDEDPREYANRCAVQWHRISVYPDRLGDLVMKNALPGTVIYLEGNLETKIFTDPVTGLVRRVREIAVRRNGRVVFLGKAGEMQQPSPSELKAVGYY